VTRRSKGHSVDAYVHGRVGDPDDLEAFRGFDVEGQLVEGRFQKQLQYSSSRNRLYVGKTLRSCIILGIWISDLACYDAVGISRNLPSPVFISYNDINDTANTDNKSSCFVFVLAR